MNLRTKSVQYGDVLRVLKTEQIGEIYIRADGKRARKVRKVVVKRKRKQIASKEDVIDIYIRADGKRVRRVRKVIRRQKSKNDVSRNVESVNMKDCEMSTRDERNITTGLLHPVHTNGETKSHCGARSARMSDKTVSGICTSLGDFTLLSHCSSVASSVTNQSDNKANRLALGTVEVEIYVNEKGQKVRRTRRMVPKTENSIRNSSGISTVNGECTYINDKGQRVRRVRKLRAKA